MSPIKYVAKAFYKAQIAYLADKGRQNEFEKTAVEITNIFKKH